MSEILCHKEPAKDTRGISLVLYEKKKYFNTVKLWTNENIRVLQGSEQAGLTVEAALAEDGFTLDSVLQSDSYNLSFSSPPPGRGDWASWAWA